MPGSVPSRENFGSVRLQVAVRSDSRGVGGPEVGGGETLFSILPKEVSETPKRAQKRLEACMIFPTIRTKEDLFSRVSHKPEIRWAVAENGCTVACYMISEPSTFDSEWARECRGIVFGPDGKIVGRPLHKFFNLGERKDCPGLGAAGTVLDKLDGSMIHTVALEAANGLPFCFKTKKSFSTEHTDVATRLCQNDQGLYEFCADVTKAGQTAIFEFRSPNHTIVIPHGVESLTLLHVRDNVSGRYWSREEVTKAGEHYGVQVVKPLELSASDLLGLAKSIRDVEGWVVQLDSQEMLKIKTGWYISVHRTCTELRDRDVVEAVLLETLDDVKASLTLAGRPLSRVLEIEHQVVGELLEIQASVEAKAAQALASGISRKEFAGSMKGDPLFSLIMLQFSGAIPDYREWYRKHQLKTWGLTSAAPIPSALP